MKATKTALQIFCEGARILGVERVSIVNLGLALEAFENSFGCDSNTISNIWNRIDVNLARPQVKHLLMTLYHLRHGRSVSTLRAVFKIDQSNADIEEIVTAFTNAINGYNSQFPIELDGSDSSSLAPVGSTCVGGTDTNSSSSSSSGGSSSSSASDESVSTSSIDASTSLDGDDGLSLMDMSTSSDEDDATPSDNSSSNHSTS